MLDVAIIGGGPAALSAAIYIARAKLSVRVFERGRVGGGLSETANIVNYPGFSGAGPDLAEKFRQQAVNFGAEVEYGECTNIEAIKDDSGRHFRLTIDDVLILARTVLVATGSEPRHLEFEPKAPVSYCALCDADFAVGKRTAVIGGGNSAVQETIYLAPMIDDLTLISHSPLKATPALQDTLRGLPNVTIRENVEPTTEILDEFEYIFVFIGKRPATRFLEKIGGVDETELLDAEGFIRTGLSREGISEASSERESTLETSFGRESMPHETIVPGLFAAGDVREHTVHQVVTAAGDGAAAATEIIRYLQEYQN